MYSTQMMSQYILKSVLLLAILILFGGFITCDHDSYIHVCIQVYNPAQVYTGLYN